MQSNLLLLCWFEAWLICKHQLGYRNSQDDLVLCKTESVSDTLWGPPARNSVFTAASWAEPVRVWALSLQGHDALHKDEYPFRDHVKTLQNPIFHLDESRMDLLAYIVEHRRLWTSLYVAFVVITRSEKGGLTLFVMLDWMPRQKPTGNMTRRHLWFRVRRQRIRASLPRRHMRIGAQYERWQVTILGEWRRFFDALFLPALRLDLLNITRDSTV